jgi:polyhydroxybutyrate depolymerase
MSFLIMNRLTAWVAAGVVCLAPIGPSGMASAPSAWSVTVGHCQLKAGDQKIPVTFAGHTYPVLTHVPANFARTRAIVINMHGATQSGPAMEASSGMDASSDRHGYAVAYPTGGVPSAEISLPYGEFWNVGGWPILGVPIPPGTRDDVRFVVVAAKQIRIALCADKRRLYATGASNGGMMSSYLGCHFANVFAAVAPVMGVRAGRAKAPDYSQPVKKDCRPSRPIALLALHGKKDPVLPYRGQPGGGEWGPAWGYSVEVALRRWVTLDGCAKQPRRSKVTASITKRVWSGCRDRVHVVAMISAVAGHSWWGHPTPVPFNLAAGPNDLSADANELIWSFLSKYRLPTRG